MSMKGTVAKINHNAQYGLYSFALKGQDGWFSLGEHPPTFSEGQAIQFDTVTKGKYTYAQSIVPWNDGGATPTPQVSQFSNAGGYKGKSGGFVKKPFGGKSDEEKQYWAAKDATQAVTQKRIEIQAARNAAIETAKALYQYDLVAKPKTKADQYDAFLALVDQIATDYLANTESKLGQGSGGVGSENKVDATNGQGDQSDSGPVGVSEEGWD